MNRMDTELDFIDCQSIEKIVMKTSYHKCDKCHNGEGNGFMSTKARGILSRTGNNQN